ncbi:hypothetical protein H257_16107 [Aphanomyces astaci]|uniref:Uncharacterized protein n=1 Tax=Aphanomyces astaci TaxID=112090 RepID=W4FLH9_APHAT|nr:hypothetical protein, variant 1 [Aphanomyces astaci]XP_009842741.1 hypothetical protein H257_16107 [Aphanomyces astaci]ETV67745.1 hypothetical protein H257_16107 [Aphanomyces astaci]ETV67746.1 hypothetical protein, variant 1 [Aphanomyces astaci]|eukprot:XP_009842740.1 hypothetical protein, variant 1 [Aphanomyces astaci]
MSTSSCQCPRRGDLAHEPGHTRTAIAAQTLTGPWVSLASWQTRHHHARRSPPCSPDTTRPDLSFVLDGNKGRYALWPKKALDKFRHVGCPRQAAMKMRYVCVCDDNSMTIPFARTCTKSLWKAQSELVA